MSDTRLCVYCQRRGVPECNRCAEATSRDSLATQLEQMRRERDEARGVATQYQASSDEYEEAYRHWRSRAEAAEALAASRPEITPEDVVAYTDWREGVNLSTSGPGYVRVTSALRAHAAKVSR